MATETVRPSTSCNVFKLKEKPLVPVNSNHVFEKKKPESAASSRSKKSSATKPIPSSRPQTSYSTLLAKSGLNSSNMRFGSYSKASFFSRHNPHPVRVRHIKGLNGVPICTVNDDGYFPDIRFSLDNLQPSQQKHFLNNQAISSSLGLNSSLFPIDTITGIQNYPYKEKAVPRFGIIPITDSWRDELKDFCFKAGLLQQNVEPNTKVSKPQTAGSVKRKTNYSASTGRLIPPPSRLSSRMSTRSAHHHHSFNHISVYPDTETLMINMLCQILQTDSVQDIQQWLVSAGEREKAMVLDLIKTGIGGEIKASKDVEPEECIQTTVSKKPTHGNKQDTEEVVLHEDRKSVCQSRNSVRSIRPLGSIPNQPEAIIEEE